MGTVTKSSIGRGDSLKLFGCALAVVAIGLGSYALADRYHISHLALFLAWMWVGFIAKSAEDFRGVGLFKRRPFLLFIVAWAFISALVFVVSWVYLSLIGWASAMLLEAVLGYFLAHKIFKAPYPWDIKRDLRKDFGL